MKSRIYGMAMMAGILMGSSGFAQAAIMSGRVLRSDESGQGVANVTVEAISYKPAYESYSTTTDAGGYFSMVNDWPDGLSFCSVKPKEENGATFSPPNISVTGGQDYQGLEYTMEPPDNSTVGLRICTLTVHIGNPELADGYFWRVWYNGGVPLTSAQTSLLESPWTDRASGDSHEWMPYDSWYVIEFEAIGGYRKPENMVVYTDGSGWGDIKQLTNNFQVTGTYEALPVLLDSSPKETESGLFCVKGFDSSSVVGSGPYMYKSSFTVFAGAAVHAGAVDLDEWGVVQITNKGNQCSFAGSTANGITSTSNVLCTEYVPAKPGYTFEESARVTVNLEGKGGVDVPLGTHWYLLCDEWKIGGFTNGQTIAVPASLSYDIEFGRAQATPGSDADDWISPESVNGSGGGVYTGEYVRPGDYSTAAPVLPPSAVVVGGGESDEEVEEPVDEMPEEPDCVKNVALDPVHPASGIFIHRETDWVSGGALPIEISRAYRTLYSYHGPFGYGWTHRYDRQLYAQDDGAIVFRDGDGKLTKFAPSGDGFYFPGEGRKGRIQLTSEGGYRYSEGTGLTQHFDEKGILSYIEDTEGNELLFEYVAGGPAPIEAQSDHSLKTNVLRIAMDYRLIEIRQRMAGGANGAIAGFLYTDSGHIEKVVLFDESGESWGELNYAYSEDGAGKLILALDRKGRPFPYTYDPKGRMQTFTMGDCACVSVSNTYNEDGLVVRQQVGGQESILDYLITGRYVRVTSQIVSLEDGSPVRERVEYFSFNENGLTTNYVLQMGHCLDSEGDCGEQDDYVQAYAYDQTGLVVQEIAEPGRPVVFTAYDEQLRPVMMTSSNHETGEVITLFTQYNDQGLVTNRYRTSSQYPGIHYDEERISYDSQGRKVKWTRVGTTGTLIRTTYGYGEFSEGGYWQLITNPDGSKEKVTFNAQGLPVRAEDPDEPASAINREYDSKGNMVRMSDGWGGEWSYEYDDAGRLIRKADSLGYETLYTYENNLLMREESGRFLGQSGAVMNYTYDEQGNRTGVYEIDLHGNSNAIYQAVFDSGNAPIRAKVAGHDLVYQFDGGGRKLAVQIDGIWHSNHVDVVSGAEVEYDAAGIGTRREYDVFGRLTNIVAAAGAEQEHAASYEYDGRGNLAVRRLSDGREDHYEYDEYGRLVHVDGDVEGERRYTYDSMGRTSSIENARGYVVYFDYDRRGNVTTVRDGTGTVLRSNRYDSLGRWVETEDARSNRVAFTYDTAGRLVSHSVPNRPDVADEVRSYTAQGALASVSNRTGAVLQYLHDDGKMRGLIWPTGLRIDYGIDENGNIAEERYSDGTAESYVWQGSQCVSRTNRAGYYEHTDYDARQLPARVITGGGVTNAYTYDALRRLVVQSNNLGAVLHYSYSTYGQLSALSNNWGGYMNIEYNTRGLPVRQGGGMTYVQEYEYDEEGNLTRLSYEGGAVEFSYDLRNRLIEKVYPGNVRIGYDYDASGNMVRMTGPSGVEITREYNEFNRLLSLAASDGFVLNAEYDEWGRLACVRDGAMTNRMIRDYLGQITTHKQEYTDGEIHYKYDQEMHPVGMVVAGQEQQYEYKRGLLVAISNWAGVFRYHWHPAIPVVQTIDYPNGMTQSNGYDNAGRLTERVYRCEDSSILEAIRYDYDLSGRVTNVVRADGRFRGYTYGAGGQLISARECLADGTAIEGRTWHYGYDGIGNRVESGCGVSTNRYVANGLNQYTAVQINGGWRTLQYGGNLAITNDDARQFSWDALCRMTQVACGGVTQALRYDPQGMLTELALSDGGEEERVRFLYDGRMPVAELSGDNEIKRFYTWGQDRYGCVQDNGGIGGLLALSEEDEHLFYMDDGFGNVMGLVNEMGKRVATYEYAPFGEHLSASDTGVEQPYRFQSKRFIEEMNLYYFGDRFYDPVFGRWLSSDPSGEEGGVNLYAYCGNNPINEIDPFGLNYRPQNAWKKEKRSECATKSEPTANGCGPEGKKILFMQNGIQNAMIPEGFFQNYGGFDFGKTACDQHDKCYGTCCSDQKQCDDQFFGDMQMECARFVENAYGESSFELFSTNGLGLAGIPVVGSVIKPVEDAVFMTKSAAGYLVGTVLQPLQFLGDLVSRLVGRGGLKSPPIQQTATEYGKHFKLVSVKALDKTKCENWAKSFHYAVTSFGEGAHTEAQNVACKCPP